jgi:predicted dehydrogenase
MGDFDAFIEVIGDGKRLKLSYDTVRSPFLTSPVDALSSPCSFGPQPYVKGLPITLQIKEVDSQGHYQERIVRPTYTDAYTLELQQLYESIKEGKPVKTDPKDAAQDLVIFDQIIGALVN